LALQHRHNELYATQLGTNRAFGPDSPSYLSAPFAKELRKIRTELFR
jgi:hypothetical protein